MSGSGPESTEVAENPLAVGPGMVVFAVACQGGRDERELACGIA